MSAYVPAVLKQQVRQQFASCCAYCRTAEHLTVAIFEVEHIVPLAAGGETTLDNLCFSCPTCNRYKGVRLTAVDPQSGITVPLFHPQQERWDDHFSWNSDSTEVIGQTPIGRATIEALRINRPQLKRVRQMWTQMGEHPPQP